MVKKLPVSGLVYSQSKGSVYYAPCLLFGGESSFADKDGFSGSLRFYKIRFYKIQHNSIQHNCVYVVVYVCRNACVWVFYLVETKACRFSNWTKAIKRMSEYENSEKHQSCLKSLKDGASALGRIDKTLIVEYNKRAAHWQNVLNVVAVIKGLAARGLPFRGHNEKTKKLYYCRFYTRHFKRG